MVKENKVINVITTNYTNIHTNKLYISNVACIGKDVVNTLLNSEICTYVVEQDLHFNDDKTIDIGDYKITITGKFLPEREWLIVSTANITQELLNHVNAAPKT